MSDDIESGVNTSGRLTIGQSIDSDLTGYYDADWFKVTLEAGQVYQFTLNGYLGRTGYPSNYVTAELQLMDSSGRLLNAAYVTNGSRSTPLTFVAGKSGSYYVGVASDDQYGQGAYTLLSKVVAQGQDDYAPNTSTTGVLTVGATLQAKFEAENDVDWFKFHADVGHSYKFSFGKDGGLVSPWDYLVYDAQGVVQSNPSPFQPLASGDYFVSLQGKSSGNYAVTLSELVDDYSANNGAPGRLEVGGVQSGVIQYRLDIDRFLVQLEQGKSYVFELSADSALLSHLSLQGRDSNDVRVDLTTLGKADGSIKVIMTAPKDGVYALDVTPDYLWNGSDGHYTLRSQPAILDDVGNTLSSALAVGVETSFSGRIEAPGDVDMFKLNVIAGQSYVLKLDAAKPDGASGLISVNAVNASGQPQATLVQNSGGSYTFIPTTSGPYYFAVNAGYSTMGNYTVSTHYATDDFAANAAGAGQLNLGLAASGKIDFLGDRDWFGMALDAGATYWFTLSSGQSTDATVPILKGGQLHLVDASGNILATTSDLYRDFSTLSFTPSLKGSYYLEVVGADSYYSTGLYQLQARPGVPDDYGNDPAHAAVLTPGVSSSGVIEVNGDVDVFKLSVTSGNHYGLQLSSNFGGSMVVTDAAGKAISLSNFYAGTGEFTATSSGNYYVSVYASSLPTRTAYTLSATAYSPDDVGDTAATAGTLDANSRVQGTINFPIDKDWFKVHLEAGRSYAFDLLGPPSADGSLTSPTQAKFTLYDSHSGWSNWNETLGTSSGSGAPHLTYVANKTGDFYIEVQGGALGGYTLVDTVTSTDVTGPALLSMTPASGALGVGLFGNIVMKFNELITLAPNVAMSLTDANGRSYAFNSNYSNKGVVMGQTLTFDPAFNLQPGMTYTLHLGGGVLDMAGNKAAIPNDMSFTTVAAVSSGTDGDDFFIGSGKGQSIQGGKGLDTVYYDNYPNTGQIFSLYKSGGTVYVRGIGVSTGDALSGIERVVFSDHAVALDIDGHGGQAYRLYQAAFNRKPDEAGVGYWLTALDRGMSLQEVAKNFIASAEFQSMYGASLSDAQYVSQLYHNVLHRDGDAGGVSYWQDVLHHGAGREQLLMAFSESPENQVALIGSIDQGFTYIPPV